MESANIVIMSYVVNKTDAETILNFIDNLYNGESRDKLILYGSKSEELLNYLTDTFQVCENCSNYNYLADENYHKEAEEFYCGCGSGLPHPDEILTDYIITSIYNISNDGYNYIIVNIL